MSENTRNFEHLVCLYDSEQQFIEMAEPFITGGLALGEPVLAATTPANLELLSSALGRRAIGVDYAESAFFGRRPPQRVAAFHRYWKDHAPNGERTRVRILAEPIWTGRSRREIAAWTQMEAALNVVLASTSISMICPYDTRTVPSDVLVNARRTHPECIDGSQVSVSQDYADPASFARPHQSSPLPEPPASARAFRVDGDLRGLRRFILGQASAHGLARDRAGLLVQAAGEVGTYLKATGLANVMVRTWEQAGAIVCHFRQPQASIGDPFLGLRPAELEPEPGDGLWLTSQICDWLEIRSSSDGRDIQLQVPSSHDAELAQPGVRWPG